jgi:hypothetical protein
MLAGGPRCLRLSTPHVGLLLAAGAALALVAWVSPRVETSVIDLPSLASIVWSTLTALALAVVAARWIGRSLATLAGLFYLSGVHVLLGGGDGPGATVATAAIGLFALANVPGRLKVDSRPAIGWAFFAVLAIGLVVEGPAGPVAILLACLAVALVSQNLRGLAFFVTPLGMAIVLLSPAAWWLMRQMGLPGIWDGDLASAVAAVSFQPERLAPVLVRTATAALPWTPFAAVAVMVGTREGHLSTPFWRLVGCWVVTPLSLVPFGILDAPAAMAMLAPPLAIVAAPGAAGVWGWCRRAWRRR